MEEETLEWKTIDSRRNVMLSKSDWTQLPDCGLSRACVAKWRLWRQELRKVTEEHFHKRRLDATKRLQELRDSQPKTEYAPAEEIAWEADGEALNRMDLTNKLKEIMEEINMTSQAPQEPSMLELLDQTSDISRGRQIARKAVRDRYNELLGEASPPVATLAMYNERLSQAIDLLSETTEAAPLLDVMAHILERTSKEVAESVIGKHRKMITEFHKLESDYLKALKAIQDADKMDELMRVVMQYGY